MTPINSWALKLLNAYLWFRFRLSFHKIHFDLNCVEDKIKIDQPVLFIANHSSWWDGLLIYELYRRLRLKKDFRIVMLESELQKFPFFRRCGAVGLIPKNKEHNKIILSALKGCCVSFFPQGQMYPQAKRPLALRPGIESLIQQLHPIQIIPVALHIEPFQQMKPTVLIKAAEPISSETPKTYKELEDLLQKNLNDVSLGWTQQIYETQGKNPWKS